MERIYLPVLLAMVLLVGCATPPPPEVENGRFYSPKYEYSFKVPSGWNVHTEIPETYNNFSQELRLAHQATMENKKTGMVIHVFGRKKDFSIKKARSNNNFISVKNQFEKRYDNYKEEDGYVDYSYKIHWPLNYQTCENPHLYVEMFHHRRLAVFDLKTTAHGLMYQCGHDQTCLIDIVANLQADRYSENIDSVLNLVNSVRKDQ